MQKECKAENLSIPSQYCDSDITLMDTKGIAMNQYYYHSCLRVDATNTALRCDDLRGLESNRLFNDLTHTASAEEVNLGTGEQLYM